MIVLKFGGTSVGSSEKMNNVLDIIEDQIQDAPVLVSSAMATCTDGIIECFETAEKKGQKEAFDKLKNLEKLHFKTSEDFLNDENLQKCKQTLNLLFAEFRSLLKGIALLHSCSIRSKDALLSMGERLSTTLLYHRCLERGIEALWMDAREFIKTDSHHGNAQVDFDLTNSLIAEMVHPKPGKVIITQGFIASDEEGSTTTLGRGGSDYSASIIGSALNAREVQIWTDVDGIMSSDPRHIEGVRTIKEVSYSEAGELAYFGAKVVHPATMQPAVGKKIPLRVLNSGNKEHQGTWIIDKVHDKGLKAIAGKKAITLININSSRMLNAYGFLKRIFSIFETYKIPVDLVSTSEVSVSLTIEQGVIPVELLEELEAIGQVTVENGKAIMCLVGQDLWKDSEFISQVFSHLKEIPVRMISLGASDINLSLVLKEENLIPAIQRLHHALLG